MEDEREVEIENDPSPPSPSPSSGHFKLFDQLELLEFEDKYVIRAVGCTNQGFSISRFDGDIQPLINEDLSGSPSKTSKICGVVGTIRLVSGTHIIVITSAKEVGKYLGFPVFRVQSLKCLPCNQALKQLSPQEKKEEAYFRNLLRVVESTPGLYYSYETDITVKYAVFLCLLLHYQEFMMR
uniref:SAC domain-containing protein n=1 Tax=Opuntia streptacantha TaxID=393608 RepID=A0A7C9E1L3_OPUST